MKSSLFLSASLSAFLASTVSAQIPLIPSVPVEETTMAVFAKAKPSKETQTINHPEPLANFRLHLEYRLPTAASAT